MSDINLSEAMLMARVVELEKRLAALESFVAVATPMLTQLHHGMMMLVGVKSGAVELTDDMKCEEVK